MTNSYEPEKKIWREEDFARMGWHDATVWGMAADPDHFEYLFDLDYIFKWVAPSDGERFFKFWGNYTGWAAGRGM